MSIGVFVALVGLMLLARPVAAQGGCETGAINRVMDTFIATYLTERMQDAMGAAQNFQTGINALMESCTSGQPLNASGSSGIVAPSPAGQSLQSAATPTATRTPIPQATVAPVNTGDGVPPGEAGDTGQGFSVQVTGLARPANDAIAGQSPFNPEVGAGEVYVVVVVVVVCPTTCDVDYFDFALTGDSGTVYSGARVYYEGRLDVRGAGGSGDLPFLIRADETNLRLLYLADRLNDVTVAYEVGEPRGTLVADTLPAPGTTATPEGGVEVIANTNLNVREGPGTDFRIAGSFPAETALVAYGRNEDGTWLRVMQGWVFAALVDGDVDGLAVVEE